MLAKSITHLPFVRQRTERLPTSLTKKQWINADRVVMAILFLGVIIAGLLYS